MSSYRIVRLYRSNLLKVEAWAVETVYDDERTDIGRLYARKSEALDELLELEKKSGAIATRPHA
jgi:hypothetical protein